MALSPDPFFSAAVHPARRAVSALFFINGFCFATWAVHIPYVQAQLDLSEGMLGLALLAVAVGSLLLMPLTGSLIARFGARRVLGAGAVGFCALLPVLLVMPNLGLLAGALLFFGGTGGTMDIAMNAEAVHIEQDHGRSIMSSFHALFSLGGLLGASVGGVLLGLGVAPPVQALGVTAGLLLGIFWALPAVAQVPAETEAGSGPMLTLPTGPLLGLGALAFLVMVSEGVIMDWSTVYMRNTLATTPGLSATGYAAFSLMMVVGRLGGDRLIRRWGGVPVVQSSAALASLGLGAALWIGTPWAAVVGFGCVGLGCANIVPVLFSSAGQVPGVSAGHALGGVATTGYLGFLIGPPLIGWTAEAVGLTAALGFVVLFTALILVSVQGVMQWALHAQQG